MENHFRSRCPHCGKIKQHIVRGTNIVGKRTKCFACGKSYVYCKSGFDNQFINDEEYQKIKERFIRNI